MSDCLVAVELAVGIYHTYFTSSGSLCMVCMLVCCGSVWCLFCSFSVLCCCGSSIESILLYSKK